jgi:hypothetical protein
MALEDNVTDLPSYCDWGSKLGSNGNFFLGVVINYI